MAPKKFYEAEFGVWVEEPDPLEKPACDAIWNGDWDLRNGPLPHCFRPRGHEGEHHETRRLSDEPGWVEFYWSDDPEDARTELRREAPDPPDGSPDPGSASGVD